MLRAELLYILKGMLTKSFATILLAKGAKPSGNSYSSFSIFWNIMYSLLWIQKKQICNTYIHQKTKTKKRNSMA
jgi:uncharacterized membrane protein